MDVRSKNSAASPNRSPRVVSAILFVAVLSFPVLAFSETIRVGYFEHPPSCFTGPDGRPAGVFVEILDVIAAREGWRLEYQAGTWDWCLWKLNNAEIDILPSMVISSRRAKQYRFSAVTIVNNWAQIYVPDGSRIQSLLDLKGKRVATLKRGFHTDGPNGIRVLNQKFQLGCRLILEDDFAGVVLAVKEGRADAAVLNRLVMRELAGDFPIKKTGIVFAATDSRFVMPRDGSKTPELAQTLDRHLLAMQKDSQSAMYRILERYMGGKQRTVEVFQTWMINAMAALAAGAILFLAVAILFRRRLNLMTHDLRESERRLKRLIEKIQVGIVVHGKDRRILECNATAEHLLGLSRDRLVGIDLAAGHLRLVREDGTDMPASDLPVMRVLSDKRSVLNVTMGVDRPDFGGIVWLLVSSMPDLDEHGEIQGIVNTFMDITERKRAEEALQDTSEKLSALFEASPLAIIALDPDGNVTLWNPAAEHLFGWEAKEVLGRFLPLVPEEKREEHKSLRERVLRGEGFYSVEACRRKKDGTKIHISISTAPLRNVKGETNGIMSVSVDITERKRMETALRASEERYRLMVETAMEGIWSIDLRGNTLFVNQQMADMLGSSIEEMQSLSVFDFLDPPQRQEVCRSLENRRRGVGEAVERCFLKKDGSRLWVIASTTPIRDREGKVVGSLGMITDITARKRVEEQLQASLVDLELAQRIAHIGNWFLDPDAGVPVWSDEVYRIYERDRALGPPALEEYKKMYTPDQYAIFHGAIQRALTEGKPYDIHLNLRLPGGKKKWVHALCQPDPIAGPAGHFLRGTIQDITDMKRAEEKLQEYSERLEEMVEERTRELKKAQKELLQKERLAVLGHFAGSVSHELRNPLAAIDSAVYFLKMKLETGDEAIQLRLAQISANIAKSTSIIQSLLNLSRMEPPKTKTIDLMDWLTETLPAAGIPDAVEVVLDVPDSGVSVDIDPEQIRMALKNIIRNAVQAMDQNGVLSIWARKIGTALAEISISDTGPGIAAEHLDKVFEPLFSTKTHGIGFGLSITKMIVENHGGTLRAESPPDGGARFVVTLPAGR